MRVTNLPKEPLLPLIRRYDLRHTTATLLLSAGENPKIVSERLGHASVVLILDTYSHAGEENRAKCIVSEVAHSRHKGKEKAAIKAA